MSHKKYIDFPAGTYDTAKIFLQADPATGALQKVNLPSTASYTGTANRIAVTGSVIDISLTFVGQSSITTLGIITAGTWNADAIGPTKGGTGLTSFNAGDIIYASAANTLAKLAASTNGYLLTLVSGLPAWAANPIPSQTSNAGKFLTTDGTNASWGSPAAGYILADGTVPLTAAWNAGAFSIETKQTSSTASTIYAGFKLSNTTTTTGTQVQYSPSIIFSGSYASFGTSYLRQYYDPSSLSANNYGLKFETSSNGTTWGGSSTYAVLYPGGSGAPGYFKLSFSGVTTSMNYLGMQSTGGITLTAGSLGYGAGTNNGATGTVIYHQMTGTHNPATGTSTSLFFNINPTMNWGGTPGAGSYEAVRINVTETAIPAGAKYLLRVGTGGASFTSKFDITSAGLVGIGITPTAFLHIKAGTSTVAQMNLAVSTAPTSPNDGDIWREDNTNTGLKVQINGVTKTITVS